MKILSLDVASQLGYAIGDVNGNLIESGTVNIKAKRPKGLNRKSIWDACYYLSDFKEFLLMLLDKHKEIGKVVFERSFGANQNSVIHQSEIHGVLKETLNAKLIPVTKITPTSHKHYVTGNGKASKQECIDCVNKIYNMECKDDNEADAIAIYRTFIGLGLINKE